MFKKPQCLLVTADKCKVILKVLLVYPQLKVIDDRGGTFCKFSILFVSCTARTINPKLKLGTLYTGIQYIEH